MTKCKTKLKAVETAAAWETIASVEAPERYGAYIGLDVHKDTIAVAVARGGRDEPEYRGEIAHTPKALAKLLRRLSEVFDGALLLFCYEAGPCG